MRGLTAFIFFFNLCAPALAEITYDHELTAQEMVQKIANIEFELSLIDQVRGAKSKSLLYPLRNYDGQQLELMRSGVAFVVVAGGIALAWAGPIGWGLAVMSSFLVGAVALDMSQAYADFLESGNTQRRVQKWLARASSEAIELHIQDLNMQEKDFIDRIQTLGHKVEIQTLPALDQP